MCGVCCVVVDSSHPEDLCDQPVDHPVVMLQRSSGVLVLSCSFIRPVCTNIDQGGSFVGAPPDNNVNRK